MINRYPTFLEAAGIDIKDLGINYTFDGVSQWKGITGEKWPNSVRFSNSKNGNAFYDVHSLYSKTRCSRFINTRDKT